MPTGSLAAIAGINGRADNDAWAALSDGAMSHYDGTKWSSVSVPSNSGLARVWAAPNGEVWAVGWAATLLHRASNLTWSLAAAPAGVTEGLNAVWGTAAGNVWAVGNQERILHYDGASWTSVRGSPSGLHLLAVWGRAANDVWAVGGDSQGVRAIALHYDGTLWNDASPQGDALRAIWGPATGSSAFAVGNRESAVRRHSGTSERRR